MAVALKGYILESAHRGKVSLEPAAVWQRCLTCRCCRTHFPWTVVENVNESFNVSKVDECGKYTELWIWITNLVFFCQLWNTATSSLIWSCSTGFLMKMHLWAAKECSSRCVQCACSVLGRHNVHCFSDNLVFEKRSTWSQACALPSPSQSSCLKYVRTPREQAISSRQAAQRSNCCLFWPGDHRIWPAHKTCSGTYSLPRYF